MGGSAARSFLEKSGGEQGNVGARTISIDLMIGGDEARSDCHSVSYT